MTTQISGTTGVSRVQDGVVVQADLAANVVGNGPAFRAYASGATSVTSSGTKIALASEDFDTAGAFDAVTNFRFQPTVAGYYLITCSIGYAGTDTVVQARIAKNGVNVSVFGTGIASALAWGSDLVYLNGTSDYIELFGLSASTQNAVASSQNTFLSGFLARAA